MSQNQIEEIEMNIDQAKEIVAMGEALDRLMGNRDFQKVIRDGYLRDEAIRLVHLKADPGMQRDDLQRHVLRDIDGIGCLTGYFNKLQFSADTARQAITDDEQAIEEIRQEEADA